MSNREELRAKAEEVRWWHAIDFGDFQSMGRDAPGRPRNASLYGVMDMMQYVDFTGLDCLDIGAVDGLISFNMKTRGARRVVATDRPAKPSDGFATARDLLGLDVEFEGDLDFENIIERLGEHRFDVIVCAGVMYHMLNPYDAVLKCRRLLKKNGILFMQSFASSTETRAILSLNSTELDTKELNTFWTPSKKAIEDMLWLGGFEVMATRWVSSPGFHAVVGRNSELAELTEAPGMIHDQHMHAMRPREMRFVLPAESSRAVYSGPRDRLDINPYKSRPNFALQPAPDSDKPVLGQSRIRQAGKVKE